MDKKIDKDNVILTYEKDIISQDENDLDTLSKNNDTQEKELNELKDKVSKLARDNNVSLTTKIKEKLHLVKKEKKNANEEPSIESYEQLFELAEASFKERGISLDDLDFNDLITEEEFEQIVNEMNEGLPREDKWTKSDFIVTFSAAAVGILMDFFLSNRNNKLTGKDSELSKKMAEKFHKHESGSPIDYQGKHFGGGNHRVLSEGHDLLRPVSGIKMIKEGKFKGFYFENGQKILVEATSNQFGTPYSTCTTIEAIAKWVLHMAADLFSAVSLPFPGYSFLRESNIRNLRILCADLYKNGFNVKNIAAQSLSTVFIEAYIRIYYSMNRIKDIPEDITIDDGYTNIDELYKDIDENHKEKLHEMLLVAHALVTTENLIKILATKQVAQINITEIIATCKYAFDVVKNTAKKNDEYAKLIYHSEGINLKWNELDEMICLE